MTAGGQGTGAAVPTVVFGSPTGGDSHLGGVGTPQYPGAFPEVSPTLRTSLCPVNHSPLCPMGTGAICSQVFLPKSKSKFYLMLPPDVTSREHSAHLTCPLSLSLVLPGVWLSHLHQALPS